MITKHRAERHGVSPVVIWNHEDTEQSNRVVSLTRGTPPAGQESRLRSRTLIADVRRQTKGVTLKLGVDIGSEQNSSMTIPNSMQLGGSIPTPENTNNASWDVAYHME